MRAFTSVVILTLLLPAGAAATSPSPPINPYVTLIEVGPSIVTNRHLSARCTSPSDCRLTLDYDVLMASAMHIVLLQYPGHRVLVDGQEVQSIALAAGQSVHIRVEVDADVRPRYRDDNPLFMVADGLWARHVLLGQRSRRLSSAHYDDAGVYCDAVTGALVQGPVIVDAVDLDAASVLSIDGVEVTAPGEFPGGERIMLTQRDVSAPPYEWVRSGGPMIGLGASTDGAGSHFAMRLGYEFGITDWMIVTGAIESDFQRQATLSLMLEGVTPNLVVLYAFGILSVSTGIGAVLEISEQEARGGVRFVTSIQAAPVGVQVTVDYYPDDNDVVTAVMGRFSL